MHSTLLPGQHGCRLTAHRRARAPSGREYLFRTVTTHEQWRRGVLAASVTAGQSSLEVLKSAQPLDRFHNQVKLVHDTFDVDKDGTLSAAEVSALVGHLSRTAVVTSDTTNTLSNMLVSFSGQHPSGASFQDLKDLFTNITSAVKQNPSLGLGSLTFEQRGQLRRKTILTDAEIAPLLFIFSAMDTGNSGKLSLNSLRQSGFVEAQMVEDKLEDADEDEDGYVTFEEYLQSYARPRDTMLAVLMMAANTLAIWLVINSPLELFLKTAIIAALVLRPQVVAKPVMKVYEMVKAIMGRAQAERELTSAYRPATS